MSNVLSEITQLSPKDCFHVVDRHKSEFTYPLHQHSEYELNFIQNAEGAKRIVGDSIEVIDKLELVLIGGKNLEHVWQQNICKSTNIREITIQFSPDLLSGTLMAKNQFNSIRKMLEAASGGISFPLEAIIKVYGRLDTLARQEDGFMQFLEFLAILYELSRFEWKVLASSSFAKAEDNSESRRVTKVKEYIDAHFDEDITLGGLTEIAGMSPSAFSHFFKIRTGRTLSNYITDLRLGHAARMLVDSTLNIAEICFACGFNNMSNFNRTFKARRNVTPKEFRHMYKKTKVTV